MFNYHSAFYYGRWDQISPGKLTTWGKPFSSKPSMRSWSPWLLWETTLKRLCTKRQGCTTSNIVTLQEHTTLVYEEWRRKFHNCASARVSTSCLLEQRQSFFFFIIIFLIYWRFIKVCLRESHVNLTVVVVIVTWIKLLHVFQSKMRYWGPHLRQANCRTFFDGQNF